MAGAASDPGPGRPRAGSRLPSRRDTARLAIQHGISRVFCGPQVKSAKRAVGGGARVLRPWLPRQPPRPAPFARRAAAVGTLQVHNRAGSKSDVEWNLFNQF